MFYFQWVDTDIQWMRINIIQGGDRLFGAVLVEGLNAASGSGDNGY